MTAALYLGHALLGVLLLAFRNARSRDRVVGIVAGIGCALSLTTWIVGLQGVSWRSTQLESASGALVAVATGCAWLLAATSPSADRWRTGALIGIASSAFGLFATNEWSVPTLLFWSCTSAALVALGAHAKAGPWRLPIVASDALFVAGIVAHAISTDEWNVPEPADEWHYWLIAVAAIVRSGAVARVGLWAGLSSSPSAGAPLLVASAFSLVAGPAQRVEPWMGLALLVAAAGWAGLRVRRSPLHVSVAGASAVSVALGAAFLVPDMAPGAGVVATLVAAVVALWPGSRGRAHAERALAFSVLPPLAAFGLAAPVIATAFGRVVEDDPPVVWIAVLGLAPLALAGGIVLGLSIARRPRTNEFSPGAVIATWALVALVVGIGISPALVRAVGERGAGAIGDEVRLHGAALVAAVIAARARPARSPGRASPMEWRFGDLRLPRLLERIVTAITMLVGIATVGTVGWITVEGLQVGFL